METNKEVPLKCGLCQKQFTSKLNLFIHNKIYRQKNMCRLANQKWSRPRVGLLKILRQHAVDKTHGCDTCMKSFNSWGSLMRHAVLHNHTQTRVSMDANHPANEAKTVNSDTNKETPSIAKSKKSGGDSGYEEVARHVKFHSSEQPYGCRICGKSFRFKCDVVRHVRGHTGDKPFFCSFCDKTFNYGGNLNKHVKRRHKDLQQTSCLLTRRRANKKGQTNRNYVSQIRGRKAKTFSAFKGSSHKEIREMKNTKTKLLPKCFECGTCGKMCEDRADIVNHLEVHTKKRCHICPICQREFKSAYICEKHKRKNHLDEDASVRRSPRASKGGNRKKFQDFVLFDEESDQENQSGKFKDSVKFQEKACFITHGETPAGSIVFECSACSSQFNSLKVVKRHLLNHNGDNVPSKPSTGKSSINFGESKTVIHLSDFEEDSSASDEEWDHGDDKKKQMKKDRSESYVFPQSRRGGLLKKQQMLNRSNIEKKVTKWSLLGGGEEDIDEDIRSRSNDDSKEYICQVCGLSFNYVSNFYKHMERLHKDIPAPRRRRLMKSSACNKTIVLELVLSSEGAAKEEKLYRCSECGYESSGTGNMYKHMRRIHRGCTIQKATTNVTTKERHQSVKFARCAAWETPGGDKLYHCSVCNYTSNFSSNVYKHIRRKHKELAIEEPQKSYINMNHNYKYADEGGDTGVFPEAKLTPQPKEIHKILVNNKSVSVLMNHDSLLTKMKSQENSWSCENEGSAKKQKMESLWKFEDSLPKNVDQETSWRQVEGESGGFEESTKSKKIESLWSFADTLPSQTKAFVEKEVEEEGLTVIQHDPSLPPVLVSQSVDMLNPLKLDGAANCHPDPQPGQGETVTVVIKPDEGSEFSESSVMTILINAEDIVQGSAGGGTSNEGVTILLNQEHSLEQKAAESLLDLAVVEETQQTVQQMQTQPESHLL